MKAFLLAAGLGTRLRPLTDTVPKCLVPIAGRPLLSYWMALFARHGIDDVLLNVHHLPEAVRAYLAATPPPVKMTLFPEPELLGSAGTVRANAAWISDGAPFVIAYADNLTGADLTDLVAVHRRSPAVLTAGLFRADEPSRCGIAEIAGGATSGPIVSFVEKPKEPRSNLANGGLYVTDARILDYIPTTTPADFGNDVLPRLGRGFYGHLLKEPLMDVGTWASYERAPVFARDAGLLELVAATER